MEHAMTARPRDISDLHLAPVVLAIDAKIDELARLNVEQLSDEVALEGNALNITWQMREDALLRTIAHLIDTHHWSLSWDPRGLRLSHDRQTLVLGIPGVFLKYLQGPVPWPAG
jgi:hypothetical protein